jgi:hypothetical protein
MMVVIHYSFTLHDHGNQPWKAYYKQVFPYYLHTSAFSLSRSGGEIYDGQVAPEGQEQSLTQAP